MLGSEDRAGMGHHGHPPIGQGLDRKPREPPALFGGRIEAQQPERTPSPDLGVGALRHEQQVAAGLRTQGGEGRQHMLQLRIVERLGRLLQGHGVPGQQQPGAGVGQQGARQHQPVGLSQQLALPVEQLPAAARSHRQIADQNAVVRCNARCRRGTGLGQVQQPSAEAVHAAGPAIERPLTEGIAAVLAMEAPCGIEACPGFHPGLDHPPHQQRLQQVRG